MPDRARFSVTASFGNRAEIEAGFVFVAGTVGWEVSNVLPMTVPPTRTPAAAKNWIANFFDRRFMTILPPTVARLLDFNPEHYSAAPFATTSFPCPKGWLSKSNRPCN